MTLWRKQHAHKSILRHTALSGSMPLLLCKSQTGSELFKPNSPAGRRNATLSSRKSFINNRVSQICICTYFPLYFNIYWKQNIFVFDLFRTFFSLFVYFVYYCLRQLMVQFCDVNDVSYFRELVSGQANGYFRAQSFYSSVRSLTATRSVVFLGRREDLMRLHTTLCLVGHKLEVAVKRLSSAAASTTKHGGLSASLRMCC